MSFNDIELQRIKKVVGGFCEEKIPDHLRSQIKVFYVVRGYDVKIIETRPDFMRNYEWTESPIARLKYDPDILTRTREVSIAPTSIGGCSKAWE